MYLLISVRKVWFFLGLMDNELTEDTLLRSAITSKTFSKIQNYYDNHTIIKNKKPKNVE